MPHLCFVLYIFVHFRDDWGNLCPIDIHLFITFHSISSLLVHRFYLNLFFILQLRTSCYVMMGDLLAVRLSSGVLKDVRIIMPNHIKT